MMSVIDIMQKQIIVVFPLILNFSIEGLLQNIFVVIFLFKIDKRLEFFLFRNLNELLPKHL